MGNNKGFQAISISPIKQQNKSFSSNSRNISQRERDTHDAIPIEKMLQDIANTPKAEQNESPYPSIPKSSRNHDPLFTCLDTITAGAAIQEWLNQLHRTSTRRSYKSSIQALFRNGPIKPSTYLSLLTQDNIEESIDRFISCNTQSTQGTINHHLRCFFSFFNFLEKSTQGEIRIRKDFKEHSKNKINSLEMKLAQPRATKKLSQEALESFLDEIRKLNSRDATIAYLLILTGEHPLDIVNITNKHLSVSDNTLIFRKKDGTLIDAKTLTPFPRHHTEMLGNIKSSPTESEAFCFTTKQGNPVQLSQIKRSFEKAGTRAKLPFRITPRILQESGKQIRKNR